jgi:ABC-2 type transport system permease protein
MLNPALYLVIFTLVFSVFLKSGIANFPIFLLSGLLVWNLFSVALSASTTSIVGNSSLVTKVFFPREILPLSAIGAALVHFVLQFVVLVLALIAFRYRIDFSALPLIPLALLAELVVLLGLCLGLAALNVYFRDLQHLLELLLLAWFWLTPIVYPVSLVASRAGSAPGRLLWQAYLLNPMTPVVLALQRVIYGQAQGTAPSVLVPAPMTWYATRLGVVLSIGLVLLVAGWLCFTRLEASFAEEL